MENEDEQETVPEGYLRFNFSPSMTKTIIADYVFSRHGRFPNYVRVNPDGSSVAEYVVVGD